LDLIRFVAADVVASRCRLAYPGYLIGGAVPRIAALDGLRGWLAWAVVLGHIVLFAGLETSHPLGSFVYHSAYWAVVVFTLISGFVISHLLLETPEPYPAFLMRRFMRLFPVFALALTVGATAVVFAADRLTHSVVATIPGYGFVGQIVSWREDWFSNWPKYFALGAIMLQGLLPGAQNAFCPPGWSVSLEWQYYLVAPLLLFLVRHRPVVTTASALAVGFLTTTVGQAFRSPSILPFIGFYFIIGSLSRLHLRSTRFAPTVPLLAVGLPLVLKSLDLLPLGVWIAFLSLISAERAGSQTLPLRIFAILLESRWARYFGTRSYSVYLLHFPVLFVLMGLGANIFRDRLQILIALTLLAPPFTLMAAELSYRFVERPGMQLGRRLGRHLIQGSRRQLASGSGV
jgi:peptidoglycan/LPS O-acetylase OafA/YrhL